MSISINSNTISGPTTITIEPDVVDDNTGLVVIDGDLRIDGATILSVGTTAQRPSTPVVGMFRFNTDILNFEGYNGTSWVEVGAASASLEGDLADQSGTEDFMEGSGTIDLNA